MPVLESRRLKMKKNFISVIVPAYQVDKYLKRCIESLCAQTYENLEILLICTKSEDNTEILCSELAKSDERIKLFPCPEKGVSNARNIALQNAEGEYIAFVDADDYVERYYLQLLHQNIQGRDISLCGFDRVKFDADGTIAQSRPELLGADIPYDRDRLFTDILCNNTIGGYLWNKLFRNDLIQKASLTFRPELSIGEDMVFITEYIKYVGSGYYSNEICYHYCHNEDSALQKMYTTGIFEESKLSNLKASRYILQSLHEDSNAAQEAASYRMVRTGMWTVFNMLKCNHFDRDILKNIQGDMSGNVLIYCKNPQSKALEKAAAVMVRVWPEGFWRVASTFVRVAPKDTIQRYVN